MRVFLMVMVGLLLTSTVLADISLSSPLAKSEVEVMSLRAERQPQLPLPGFCLGFGSTGEEITGMVTFSFTLKAVKPATVDIFLVDESPALGIAVPASMVAKAIGLELGPSWDTWLSAVSVGPWAGYHDEDFQGGFYYRLTALNVEF